jgi:hypothetical protein
MSDEYTDTRQEAGKNSDSPKGVDSDEWVYIAYCHFQFSLHQQFGFCNCCILRIPRRSSLTLTPRIRTNILDRFRDRFKYLHDDLVKVSWLLNPLLFHVKKYFINPNFYQVFSLHIAALSYGISMLFLKIGTSHLISIICFIDFFLFLYTWM